MFNFSLQEYEGLSSRQESQMPSPTSQGHGRQGMFGGRSGSGLQGKRRADVGSRIEDEAAVGRPSGIERVTLDKGSGRATVDRHAEEVGDVVIVHRRSNRLAVGCPGGSALQVQRV